MTIRRSIPLVLAVAVVSGVAIALLAPGEHTGDTDLVAPPEPGPLDELAKSFDREYEVFPIAESALPRTGRPAQPQTGSPLPLEPVAGLRFDLPGSSDGFLFLYGEETEPKPGKNLALVDAVTYFYGVNGCGRYVWFIEGEKESLGEDWIGHVGKALAKDGADCRRQWSAIT